jgi:hypothetical protein
MPEMLCRVANSKPGSNAKGDWRFVLRPVILSIVKMQNQFERSRPRAMLVAT